MQIPAAYRAFNVVLGPLAPALVGRLAARMFLTPRLPPASGPQALKAPRATLALPEGGRISLWGNGPLVLLVPGWSSSPDRLSTLIEALVRQDYTVGAMTPPGHERGAPRLSHPEAFTQALLTAGRALGAAHAVIGHSMGAAAALNAASRGLLVRHVVSIAGPAAIRGVLDRFIVGAGLPPRAAEHFRRTVVNTTGRPEHAFDIRGFGSRIRQSVLLVHDEDDREIPVEESLQLQAYLPASTTLRTQGHGHRRIVDSDDVRYAILSFLATGQTANPDLVGVSSAQHTLLDDHG